MDFPGDIRAWEAEKHLSSALLLGHQNEWAVLSPNTANEVLNNSDGSVFAYGKFWPILAALYSLDFRVPKIDDGNYKIIEMPIAPPPRGFGPAGRIRAGGSFEAWAKDERVKEAWNVLKQRHSLTHRNDPFENVREVFGLLDGELLGPWGRSME